MDPTRLVVERLQEVDREGELTERIFLASFDHSRTDLQEAMANSVDGAMIWGGEEAVSQVRALPFPALGTSALGFGPRLSVAAMDAGVWGERKERASWCRRMARDVWQFEQQACSSPQTLFLERGDGCDAAEFVEDLKASFQEENRAHPRLEIEPALTSAICQVRASWLLDDVANRASFPQSTDWTILQGKGVEIPEPTQGRTLSVLVADDLLEAISKFDGTVQTLGLAVKDARREEVLADAAGRHGVDRVVRLGQMHVFGSPWGWDGPGASDGPGGAACAFSGLSGSAPIKESVKMKTAEAFLEAMDRKAKMFGSRARGPRLKPIGNYARGC